MSTNNVTRAKRNAARGTYGSPTRQQPEWDLQCQIAEYLRLRYPSVMFLSDVKAAVKLTIPQSVRLKKVQAKDFACPDLMIFAARRGYHGLFMELKAKSPFLKNGALSADPHLARQADAHAALEAEGYRADFFWDFDKARHFIDLYLSV
jgi:hypothetical protein